jgi:lipoate-protein ligase A
VIAPEDHEHQLPVGEVHETVRLSVDSRESEIRSGVARVEMELRKFGHGDASAVGFLAFRGPRRIGGTPISATGRGVREAHREPGLTTWVDVRVSCADDVRTDEVILRRAVPAVRVAVLSDRAVSYGVGVRAEAPFLARSVKEGVPTVRRTTGGTGLLHAPGDLAWSIVLPRGDPRVGRDFVRAYARLGEGVVRFLAERGISARWQDPPGTDPDYCLLSARGLVLKHGEKVLGGAAQHLAMGTLLHHGILPLEIDRPLLRRLFGLSIGASERLTSLRELGIRDGPETLSWKLAASLADSLTVR